MILAALARRLRFAVRHRTLKRIVRVSPAEVAACGRTRDGKLPARCPHQGASLEGGRVLGDALVCHWHGCAFDLAGGGRTPMRGRH